ncbi:MAG: hypothetical protein CMJ69_20375 [Planctomycetaceae bacterium]|nr:hypothetical protein [Planctomycetaceae bacterium]
MIQQLKGAKKETRSPHPANLIKTHEPKRRFSEPASPRGLRRQIGLPQTRVVALAIRTIHLYRGSVGWVIENTNFA